MADAIEHPVKDLLDGCPYVRGTAECFGYSEGECKDCEVRPYLENILRIKLNDDVL